MSPNHRISNYKIQPKMKTCSVITWFFRESKWPLEIEVAVSEDFQNVYIYIYHIKSYHIILYHIILYYIILYHIILYHIILYYICIFNHETYNKRMGLQEWGLTPQMLVTVASLHRVGCGMWPDSTAFYSSSMMIIEYYPLVNVYIAMEDHHL